MNMSIILETFKMKKQILTLISAFVLVSPFQLSSADNIKQSKYEKWLKKTTKDLVSEGQVIHTDLGDIQVVIKGDGPVVVALHGGFGGWDQGELVAQGLVQNGFKVISVSRPGYLATPIYTTPPLEETTASQQADLIAALLAKLNIPKVSVVGFSAGAPVAYEFGLNYPELTNSVVLECIGANPSEDGFFYIALGAILTTETAAIDYTTYLLHLSLNKEYYSSALEFSPQDTDLTGIALQKRTAYIVNHISQYNFLRNMLIATIPVSPRLLGTLNDFLGIDYWNTFMPPMPSQYSLPTLIIQAINDSNGYYPTAQVVNAGLPTSTLISVPESGHFIWLGPTTNQWQKQLVQFLKANS